MYIISIVGWSLVGKTTLCNKLMDYYSSNGYKCAYKSHGHITNTPASEAQYRKAMGALEKWSYDNFKYLEKYFKYGFKSLELSFDNYLKKSEMFSNVDLLFLDRHFADHIVAAQFFNYDFALKFVMPPGYIQFLITCEYKEILRRSKVRKDNHSILTDYFLHAQCRYDYLQGLYLSYVSQAEYSHHTFDNTNFNVMPNIINKINEIIGVNEKK